MSLRPERGRVDALVILMDHPLAPAPVGRSYPTLAVANEDQNPLHVVHPSSGSAGPTVWSVKRAVWFCSEGKVRTDNTVTGPVLAVWVFVIGD